MAKTNLGWQEFPSVHIRVSAFSWRVQLTTPIFLAIYFKFSCLRHPSAVFHLLEKLTEMKLVVNCLGSEIHSVLTVQKHMTICLVMVWRPAQCSGVSALRRVWLWICLAVSLRCIYLGYTKPQMLQRIYIYNKNILQALFEISMYVSNLSSKSQNPRV